MALAVAGAGCYLILYTLAIFTFAFTFFDTETLGDAFTYDAVVMASDTFANDAIVMALVSGLACGLLPSHTTTNTSSFIRISLILLIAAAVPVVAMPGGVQGQQRDAIAAGVALMMLGGQLAGAVGKRPADERAAPNKSKKARKAMKGNRSAKKKVPLPAAPKPKSAHALREDAAQKARDSAAEHGNATAPGKKFMVFVNANGLQCEGSEAGHLVTSHVDLFGRTKGFLEATTAASKHPKVQAAREKFRADGTGKNKSWQQVNQRFALFERYMLANKFPYGAYLESLGVRRCHGMALEDRAFEVSDDFFYSHVFY